MQEGMNGDSASTMRSTLSSQSTTEEITRTSRRSRDRASRTGSFEHSETSTFFSQDSASGESAPPPRDSLPLRSPNLSLISVLTHRTISKSAIPPPKKTAQKQGHRRVLQDGSTTYKKAESHDIMAGIQFGLRHSIGGINPKEQRDILMENFDEIEVVLCPSAGTIHTPAHRHPDFIFKTYAPKVFRYFRQTFGIKPDDFLVSLCNEPLHEKSNPGASGSLFYLSPDDNFIIKTVQSREAVFLRKLLPGYFLNLTQNTRTLLPKVFGLYCYKTHMGRCIYFVIMNNLLPSHLSFRQCFDLKGSTLGREASAKEKAKKHPTYKDLDFLSLHSNSLRLERVTYDALIRVVERDCRVLASFKIMDYSMLLGIHFLDRASVQLLRERRRTQVTNSYAFGLHESLALDNKQDVNFGGGILAFLQNDEPVLLFLGIIDILQQYRLHKVAEHNIKSLIYERDHISVHNPRFYSKRFQNFIQNKVMRPMPTSEVQAIMASNPIFNVVANTATSPDNAHKKQLVVWHGAANALRVSPAGALRPESGQSGHTGRLASPYFLRKTSSLPEWCSATADTRGEDLIGLASIQPR